MFHYGYAYSVKISALIHATFDSTWLSKSKYSVVNAVVTYPGKSFEEKDKTHSMR